MRLKFKGFQLSENKHQTPAGSNDNCQMLGPVTNLRALDFHYYLRQSKRQIKILSCTTN